MTRMDAAITFPLEGVARLAIGDPTPTPALVDPHGTVPPHWLQLRVQGHAGVSRAGRAEIQVAATGARPGLEFVVRRVEDGWAVEVPLTPGDRCYGMGEKTGFLDKRGRSYRMWNTDDASLHGETTDPLYLSVPWGIVHAPGLSTFGLYLDDPARTTWDVGAGNPDLLTIRTPRPALDLYLVAGPQLADVVRRFAHLVGLPPLPPRWALGYHQCRYSYMSADEVAEIAREFRARHLPCDSIWLDIDYMDGYRVFTFDPERFAEPAKLVADLSEQDFAVVAIVDPGVKKEAGFGVWESGLEQGVFVSDADGVPFVGEVWPGPVGFPDFTRPEVRAWWAEQHAPLLEAGITGIWNDMNEPAAFKLPGHTIPSDTRHGPAGKISHAEAHNRYGLDEARATDAALRAARPQDRPFILTRAGFAGIGRLAAAWTGDNTSAWAHLEMSLPMLMNLGLSAIPFCGADVGGFQKDCTAELLARWMQVGAFYPFFRNHSAKGTRDQEPWRFGPEVEAISRRALEMRYELMPYLATCFWLASTEGLPVFRPLVLQWPDDPELADLCDQALVGSDLMIAPVVRPGVRHRAVYLPGPGWYDLASGEFYEHGGWKVVAAPLDKIPVFARSGAIIPMLPAAKATAAQDRRLLTLAVFPAPRVAGEWLDEDGATTAYAKGAYEHWRFEGIAAGRALSLDLRPLHRGYGSPTAAVRITVPGRTVYEGPLQAGRLEIAL